MVMRVGSFFPFQATYYLNGHSFIEQELNRAGIGFRKHDNAFLSVAEPAALQAASSTPRWSNSSTGTTSFAPTASTRS